MKREGGSLDRKVPSECGRLPMSIKCDKETGVSVVGEADMEGKTP